MVTPAGTAGFDVDGGGSGASGEPGGGSKRKWPMVMNIARFF